MIISIANSYYAKLFDTEIELTEFKKLHKLS